jgi:hypothetical protein
MVNSVDLIPPSIVVSSFFVWSAPGGTEHTQCQAAQAQEDEALAAGR